MTDRLKLRVIVIAHRLSSYNAYPDVDNLMAEIARYDLRMWWSWKPTA